ncbi:MULTISPECIES: hypothetical protein [Rhizobium]|jgi:hypothetical protein|uniref:hypothetical protein n=1 Tax=Rhizobium TaxID=379 RepID=UPI000380A1AB
MTKRKRAFFVKRVRDGKKGFAKADYGKREVAIEDIGKSKWKPKKSKHKRSGEGHKMALTLPHNRRTLLTAPISLCALSGPARAADVIDHDRVQGFPDSTSGFVWHETQRMK